MTVNVTELASKLLEIDDLNEWLGEASDLSIAIYRASLTDDDAAWMQQCIVANDAQALRIAARSIVDGASQL